MGWFNWRNKSKSRTKSTLAPSRKDKPDNTWSDKHLERERKRLQALVDMGYGGKFGEEFKRDLKNVERIIEERELEEQEQANREEVRKAEEGYMMNNPGDMGYGQLKRKKKKKKTRRSKSKSKSKSRSKSRSRSKSKSKSKSNKKRTNKKRTKKKRTKRNNLTKRR